MAMTCCHNIDEQMSQKRDDQMSDEQLSHNLEEDSETGNEQKGKF